MGATFPFGVDVGAMVAERVRRERNARALERQAVRTFGAWGAAGSGLCNSAARTTSGSSQAAGGCGNRPVGDRYSKWNMKAGDFGLGDGGVQNFSVAPMEDMIANFRYAHAVDAWRSLEHISQPDIVANADVKFAVPPESEWGADCGHALLGSCSSEPPSVDATYATDACAGSSSAASLVIFEPVLVEKLCSTRFRSLLYRAWCLLLANRDIVEWVTCLVFGDAYKGEIVGKLMGFDMVSEYVFLTESYVEVWCTDCDSAAAWSHYWFGGYMYFCNNHDTVRAWQNVMESGSDEDKLCAAIDCAAVVAHELTHIALYDFAYHEPGGREDCRRAHLFHSSLRWALLRRYLATKRSLCCTDLDHFMENEVGSISTSVCPAAHD